MSIRPLAIQESWAWRHRTGRAPAALGGVFADGTFVVTFGLTKKGRQQNLEPEPGVGPNGELYVMSSKDGGETFGAASKTTDWTPDRQQSEGGMLAQLAVDTGSGTLKEQQATPGRQRNQVTSELLSALRCP